MFRIIHIGIAALLVLGLTACSKSPDQQTIAVVGGEKITQGEFDAFMKFKRLNEKDAKRIEKLLDQYLERAALAAVIEKEALLDQAAVEAEISEFRKEMLISRYFEKYLAEKVTDQEIENYYNTHASEYEKRKVHVAHLLIRTNPKMGEVERKAKLTLAQEAYSKLRTGVPFAEIAEKYSEDKSSAKKGGDLGWLNEGSIDARFSKQVFSMKPGDISEPFETPFGFHVVTVIEGPEVVKQPLSAVKGNIRYQLRGQAKQAEMERLLGKLKIEKK